MATKKEEQALEVVNKEVAVPTPSRLDLTAMGYSLEELQELSQMDIAPGDLRIPYAKFMAKDDRDHKRGNIVLPEGEIIDGLAGQTLTLTIIDFQKSRVYFPKPFKAGNTFICRSADGLRGTDGKYIGRECSSCEFAEYGEDKSAPPCSDTRLLFCGTEDGSLFHLPLKGLSVPAFTKFVSTLQLRWLPKVKSWLGVPEISGLRIVVGAEIYESANGPFPRATFKVDPKQPYVSEETLHMYLDAKSGYKRNHRQNATSEMLQHINQDDTDLGGNSGLF